MSTDTIQEINARNIKTVLKRGGFQTGGAGSRGVWVASNIDRNGNRAMNVKTSTRKSHALGISTPRLVIPVEGVRLHMECGAWEHLSQRFATESPKVIAYLTGLGYQVKVDTYGDLLVLNNA